MVIWGFGDLFICNFSTFYFELSTLNFSLLKMVIWLFGDLFICNFLTLNFSLILSSAYYSFDDLESSNECMHFELSTLALF